MKQKLILAMSDIEINIGIENSGSNHWKNSLKYEYVHWKDSEERYNKKVKEEKNNGRWRWLINSDYTKYWLEMTNLK